MHTVNIIDIKEVLYQVNEELFIPDPYKLVKIDLYHRIGVHTGVKRVKFTLGVHIHYQESSDKLAEMAIDNFFELPDMNQYQLKDNDLILPSEVLETIVRESVAHLRSLFKIRLSGTPYQQIIIPLDDAKNVTAHFFPHLIRNEKGVMPDLIGKVEA